MIQPHSFKTLCMSLLIATSAVHLQADWDWKDVATAGLIGAGIGVCAYAATRPESPHTVKRNAEYAYDTLYRENKYLIKASQSVRAHAFYEMLDLTSSKGRSYHPDYWYITTRYNCGDCIDFAPLLRGHAALLNDIETLRVHRAALIDCFGSVRAARHEFYHFDELESLIRNVEIIAGQIECSDCFKEAQRDYKRYCLYKEDIARAERSLADARAHMRALKKPTYCAQPEKVNYSMSLTWNN